METYCINKSYFEVVYFVEKFGPDEKEYSVINNIVNTIEDPGESNSFKELIKPVLSKNSLFGHTFIKPFGYAGDYLLIEKIYQNYISADPKYSKWDKFYHSQKATAAVRNRKKYFIHTMNELYQHSKKPLDVLILGSGPATDVFEFLSQDNEFQINFDLLDIDERAINYSKIKNRHFLDKMQFIKKNVLRFFPEKKYDLIWSAGLFDYLNDRIFISLVNRFNQYIKKSGEMVIGNFSINNPTRKVMEIMAEWYLNHRSSDDLMQLAAESGINTKYVTVENEPLGINLFLRIKK